MHAPILLEDASIILEHTISTGAPFEALEAVTKLGMVTSLLQGFRCMTAVAGVSASFKEIERRELPKRYHVFAAKSSLALYALSNGCPAARRQLADAWQPVTAAFCRSMAPNVLQVLFCYNSRVPRPWCIAQGGGPEPLHHLRPVSVFVIAQH